MICSWSDGYNISELLKYRIITNSLFVLLIQICILILLLINKSFAQPTIQWQYSYGGSSDDVIESVEYTKNGGFVVAGYTLSNNGTVTTNYGGEDFWILKLDSLGINDWEHNYGGTNGDFAKSINQTSDGGYIVAGCTFSNDSNVSGNHGARDGWIIKLDSVGNIQWSKCLGGTDWDRINDIKQTLDGGYILAGDTKSNDGDVSGNHGASDFWVLKLDSSGGFVWKECLGGTGDEWAMSVSQSIDSGYVLVGFTNSNDGDIIAGTNHGYDDFWIVKLNSLGAIIWQKCFGGTNNEWAESVKQTTDGGYIVSGWTSSNNGNVSGNHGIAEDYWIIKLNANGNLIWQKCLGGSNYDNAYSINLTNDGGYLIAGYTNSTDGDVFGNHSGGDCWIVKLDSVGLLKWQKCLGGTNWDFAVSVQQTSDGGIIVGANSSSSDGDLTFNNGNLDYWLIKLSNISGYFEEPYPTPCIVVYPNPSNSVFKIINTCNGFSNLVTIYDIYGRVIFKQLINNNVENEINLNQVKPGPYLLNIENNELSVQMKIIVAY